MSHLVCDNKRRVFVFSGKGDSAQVRHRNDGSVCGERFLHHGNNIFTPEAVLTFNASGQTLSRGVTV